MEASNYRIIDVETSLHVLHSDMECVLLSSLWLANVVESYLPTITVVCPKWSLKNSAPGLQECLQHLRVIKVLCLIVVWT